MQPALPQLSKAADSRGRGYVAGYAVSLRNLATAAITATSVVAAASAAVAAYATQWEPYHPRLRTRQVSVPAHWPALTLLHVSDLHLRLGETRLIDAQCRFLAGVAPSPDIVCATGDLCERSEDAPLVADVLGRLQPRFGTYAVLGNHEYDAPPSATVGRSGGVLASLFRLAFPRVRSRGVVDADAIAEYLTSAGITLLRNTGVRVAIGSQSSWIAGSDSVWARRANIAAAMRGRRPDEGTLALVHEPEAAFAAVRSGAHLVLAGHTHGGQVRLPFVGAPYYHRADRRLQIAAGSQVVHGVPLHITAGLGQMLPLRLMCPPEAVLIRCVPRLA